MRTSNYIILFIICQCLFVNALFAQSTKPTGKRPRIGLVLSGGGAKGLAHIGVLKVLEEAGIYPDYIGGTSMGSIIGAYYAIGYSADSIERIARQLNWQELLTDKINRRYLSMDDKMNDGKYFAPIPIHNGKIELPSGVISGQNINMLFSHLAFPEYAQTDFSKFPIPFLCIGSDVVNGEAVVLNKGNLAEAIRASMAIPTVFTPVEIDGKLLVDGGVFNNLPVTEVREMGADIIIAVNVGFIRSNKERLRSFVSILEQSFFLQNQKDVAARLANCNFVITPKLTDYNVSSFMQTDTLIKLGESAARQQFASLRHLADSLNKLYPNDVMKPAKLAPLDSVFINAFEINGLKNIPRAMVRGYFDFMAPTWVKVEQIENGIQRMYGSLFFKLVTYRIVKGIDGYVLQLNVEERSHSRYTVGVNFNSDFNASLKANATFKNLWLDGSKLSVNALLGEQPVLDATYILDNTWSPLLSERKNKNQWKWDVGTSFYASNYKISYFLNKEEYTSSRISDFVFSLFTQTVFRNSVSFGVGAQTEFTMLKADLLSFSYKSEKKNLVNLYSYLKYDNLDKSYFPTSGFQLQIESKYLTAINSHNKSVPYVSVRTFNAVPINESLTLHYGVNGGVTLADTSMAYYHFMAGGLNSFAVKNSFRFLGYHYLELSNLNMLSTMLDLQFLFYKKHYITLKSNLGTFAKNQIDLLDPQGVKYGIGVSYGYNTFIGPLEVTLMHSGDHNLMAHFTVGFWF